MISYETNLKRMKFKKEEIDHIYETLRSMCKHTRKIWKEKYGGFYCEVCEKFLPRGGI
jgi:RNA polymerase-binding transcription factor DksA